MTADGDLIRYGRDLIAHTAVYLGSKATVKQITNGMNCQNCQKYTKDENLCIRLYRMDFRPAFSD